MSSAEYRPARPLLLDVSQVPACCTDHAIEGLYKALHDEEGRRHDVWSPHEDPFLTELVEQFTQSGLTQLGELKSALWSALREHLGKQAGGASGMARPAALAPWTAEHAQMVRAYLDGLSGPLAIEDWVLLVEYLVHRYLPVGTLISEVEWLVTRAAIMGVVKAHAQQAPAASAVAAVLPLLPVTVDEAVHRFGLRDAAEHILRYARAHAAEQVTGLSEAARAAIKGEVLGHVRAQLLGEPVTWRALEGRLLERFDALNRDWRRIAVTEAGEACCQGVIASLAPGAFVRRIEMYHGACDWCRRLDGRVLKVVSPDAKDKDGQNEVWVGKTNYGRSRSPHKRVGDELVPRGPDELWWPAAGLQHPHCRGRWEPVKVAQGELPPSVASVIQKIYQTPQK